MMNRKLKRCQILIIGAGVTGTSLAFVLEKFGNFGKVVILEKYEAPAMVNSHPLNNAQTSHDGSTETNHSHAEAMKIKSAATALRTYVDAHKDTPGLSCITDRMALGVGEKQVAFLEQRFIDFKPDFPDLELLYRDDLKIREPKVVEGRDPNIPICALNSSLGYAINYKILSELFLKEAPGTEVQFSTTVDTIEKGGHGYIVTTDTDDVYDADVVVCAAGAYSLLFAYALGYAKNLGILSIAGNFYSAGKQLNNKVYTIQEDGIPFAAEHGDPDVLDQNDTRFGPTVRIVAMLERHNYKTVKDWAKTPIFSPRGAWAFYKIMKDPRILRFALKSIAFDIPIIGKWLFLKTARKIVPTLKYSDLKLRKGAGGIRPQIVNVETGETQMGESTVVGDNILFIPTPSPGASTCIGNADTNADQIAHFLGDPELYDSAAYRAVYAPNEKAAA